MKTFLIRTFVASTIIAAAMASLLPLMPQSGGIVTRNSGPSVPLPKVVLFKHVNVRSWFVKHGRPIPAMLAAIKPAQSKWSMYRRIKNRPGHEDYDSLVKQLTLQPTVVYDLEAIKLPQDEKLASQALAAMTRKGKSFYVMDNNKDNNLRVWLFQAKENAKGGVDFTYHNRFTGGNNFEVIKALNAVRHLH
ncbi:hypothetical protein NDA11_000797 [Ustilago hordei]|uniref:Uncharacterized protein n=1 Tax=Ustilago hordei TaxID=120017 RepID=I2FUC1_USTHO|nr:uncharacterized protein UHO2_04943 [Ustilago hordei]KAJ1043218.1 hypothetical protein NDA10_000818 [Ustilago hordei]KAJ1573151.1 hypothetical protein NDA12_007364 [Ustilago hordei]KAJ1577426.1 hypothetical protein NDA11_000797 [Ustilago hordei]KAJ1582115.1 hypothetical protein NDA15_002737 [Ustilago hordei]KAJ1597690.1 hypothetical protein NDA14_001191 [Ustilago hordei]